MRPARAGAQRHTRSEVRLCRLDRILRLLVLIEVDHEVLAVPVGVIDAGVHVDVELVVREIRCQVQRLTAVDVEVVAQRGEVHLVAVLCLDEVLRRIAELDRRANDIDARLRAGCVELADIRVVVLILVDRLLAHVDCAARLERIVVRLDDVELEVLATALRRELCRLEAEHTAVDIGLRLAARVERIRCRDADLILRVCAGRALQGRIERFCALDLQAVIDLRLLELCSCRILALLRDAQARVLRKGQIDGILQGKVCAGCRRHPEEHGSHEQRRSPAARSSLHFYPLLCSVRYAIIRYDATDPYFMLLSSNKYMLE